MLGVGNEQQWAGDSMIRSPEHILRGHTRFPEWREKRQHWLLLQEIHHQVVMGANNKHMQKHTLDKEWMRLWLCLKTTSSPQKHIKDKFMAYTTRLVFACFKILQWGISLVIQKVKLCTPNVGRLGSIAGQGPDPTCHNSRVRMLQLRPSAVERKIL